MDVLKTFHDIRTSGSAKTISDQIAATLTLAQQVADLNDIMRQILALLESK